MEWRRIRVDWEELEEAFADTSSDHRYYLDRETGAVHFFSSYLDDEEEEEDERAITGEDRYVLIHPDRRRVSFQELVEFVTSLEGESERRVLRTTLSRAEGYARFEELIENLPAARKKWQRFVQDRLRSRIVDWLDEVGIEPL